MPISTSIPPSSIADALTKQGLKAQAVSIEGFVEPSHTLTEEQIQHKGSTDTFDGEAVMEFFTKFEGVVMRIVGLVIVWRTREFLNECGLTSLMWSDFVV